MARHVASKIRMAIVAMHTDRASFSSLHRLLSFACIEAVVAERANPHPDWFGAVVLLAVHTKHALDAINETTFGIRLTTTGGPQSLVIVVPNDLCCEYDCCYE